MLNTIKPTTKINGKVKQATKVMTPVTNKGSMRPSSDSDRGQMRQA
jgi:hypothetical protein